MAAGRQPIKIFDHEYNEFYESEIRKAKLFVHGFVTRWLVSCSSSNCGNRFTSYFVGHYFYTWDSSDSWLASFSSEPFNIIGSFIVEYLSVSVPVIKLARHEEGIGCSNFNIGRARGFNHRYDYGGQF